eukprot:8600205-Pyramimonas_sp.AAC.1
MSPQETKSVPFLYLDSGHGVLGVLLLLLVLAGKQQVDIARLEVLEHAVQRRLLVHTLHVPGGPVP